MIVVSTERRITRRSVFCFCLLDGLLLEDGGEGGDEEGEDGFREEDRAETDL